MANEPKTYVPRSSAKEIIGQGWTILKLSFDAKELAEFARNNQNDRGYLNLCVTARREAGKHGETHSVWLDTWKPDPNKRRSQAAQPDQTPQRDAEGEPSDVPF